MNLFYLLLSCDFISWCCVVFCIQGAGVANGTDSSCQNSCLDISVTCNDYLKKSRVRVNATHSFITNEGGNWGGIILKYSWTCKVANVGGMVVCNYELSHTKWLPK